MPFQKKLPNKAIVCTSLRGFDVQLDMSLTDLLNHRGNPQRAFILTVLISRLLVITSQVAVEFKRNIHQSWKQLNWSNLHLTFARPLFKLAWGRVCVKCIIRRAEFYRVSGLSARHAIYNNLKYIPLIVIAGRVPYCFCIPCPIAKQVQNM